MRYRLFALGLIALAALTAGCQFFPGPGPW
jgi:hypothetical protein